MRAVMLAFLCAVGLPGAAALAAPDGSGQSGVMVEAKPGFWTAAPAAGDPQPAAPSVVSGRLECTGRAPAANCPPPASQEPPPVYTEAYAYPEEPDWAELPWSFEVVPVIVLARPFDHFHHHSRFHRHFARNFGHHPGGGLGHASFGFGHSLAASFGSFSGSFR